MCSNRSLLVSDSFTATETAKRRGLEATLIVAALAVVLAPLVFWQGGVLEEETISFIRHYLDARPLVRQVLDTHTNDFGTYQARELSYFFDALDARFFRALLVRDHVLFFNLSTLLAGCLTVALVAWGGPVAFPHLSRALALSGLLVYLSTCVLSSTQGIFYRATKPLVAPCFLAGLMALRLATRPTDSRDRPVLWPALLFAVATLATLLDRQGFFETAAGAVCLGLMSLAQRRFVPATVALAAAAAVGLAYNHWLGPWLIHSVNGYWPSLAYQQFSVDEVLKLTAFERGGHLTLVFLASFVGSLSPLALVGLGVLAFSIARPGSRSGQEAPTKDEGRPALLALAVFGACQLLLVTLMVIRQPYMYDIRDGWRWYHPLPLHAMLLAGMFWLLDHRELIAGSPRERWAMAALALIVVANLGQWSVNRGLMEQGPWFGKVSQQAASLRTSLRAGEAQPTLQGVYRRFYFYCLESSPAILARSKPQAGEGRGFYVAELEGGQQRAASRGRSTVRLLAPSAGRYVLRGELRSEQPGDTVRLYLPGGGVVEARCGDPCHGPIPIEVPLDLSAGVSELRLESERGEVEKAAGGGRRRVAFSAALPFRLEKQ